MNVNENGLSISISPEGVHFTITAPKGSLFWRQAAQRLEALHRELSASGVRDMRAYYANDPRDYEAERLDNLLLKLC